MLLRGLGGSEGGNSRWTWPAGTEIEKRLATVRVFVVGVTIYGMYLNGGGGVVGVVDSGGDEALEGGARMEPSDSVDGLKQGISIELEIT